MGALRLDWFDFVAYHYAGFLLSVAGLGSVFLGAAWLLDRFPMRRSAADRHAVWWLALFASVALPMAGLVINMVRGSFEQSLAADASAVRVKPAGSLKLPSGIAAPLTLRSATAHRRILVPVSTQMGRTASGIALLGTVFALTRLVRAQWRRRTLDFRTPRPLDLNWTHLMDCLPQRLGVRRPIQLLFHREQLAPMTWGTWRPVISLPESALDWPPERREFVLLHELGHVRRWDAFLQGCADVLLALAWYHPGCWLAASRLRLEREIACDDLVICHGDSRSSNYATELLALAKTFSSSCQRATLGMAHPHRLSVRVSAILDQARLRRFTAGPGIWAGALMALAIVVPYPTPIRAEQRHGETNVSASSSTNLGNPVLASEQTSLENSLLASQERLNALRSEVREIQRKLGPPAGDDRISDAVIRVSQIRADVQTKLTQHELLLAHLRGLDERSLPIALVGSFPEDPVIQQLWAHRMSAEIDEELARDEDGAESKDSKKARRRMMLVDRKISDRAKGILMGLETQIETHREELRNLDREAQLANKEQERLAKELALSEAAMERERSHILALNEQLRRATRGSETSKAPSTTRPSRSQQDP